MNYSINVINWCALAPGLSTKEQWYHWAVQPTHNWALPIPKTDKIPMMTARRMSVGSRLAVQVAIELLDSSTEHIIMTSRHGELERTHKVLTHLNNKIEASPTDFTMSVHNTAAGLATIITQKSLPVSSLSAGQDSFQQGLIEAIATLHAGAKSVLLVDFDGIIPDVYQTGMNTYRSPYALGLLLTLGDNLHCSATTKTATHNEELVQSLTFLKAWLSQDMPLVINGYRQNWLWS